MFMTTWEIAFTTAAENYIVATIPRSYNNDTCSCAALSSPSCWRPLDFVLNNGIITIPGFVGGCLPVDGLRQSTLECLFDSACLIMLSTLLNSSMVPPSLNASIVTQFPYLTTTIGSIIDELFVEEWINTSNFSAYYQECSPHLCRVTLNENNNVIYMITTLLGFYSGLTLCLRFIILRSFLAFKTVRYLRQKRRQNKTNVAYRNTTDQSTEI
ncbi:unnamed protein product [Rotaria sp. Silwood2]|nr:unnamed protein product [Rotaria sp. Silwood2]